MKEKAMIFFLGCLASIFSNYMVENSFAYRDKLGSLSADLGERVSLSSLSPDNLIRVLLVEKRSAGSRNFNLILRSDSHVKNRTIFKSTDQEMLSGSERISWSDDNEKLALLSRNFLLGRDEREKFKLSTGETFVLVYDIKKDILRCPESISKLNNCSPLEPSDISYFKKNNNF
jgi:hypothetical protein